MRLVEPYVAFYDPDYALAAVLVLCAGIAGVLVGRGREAPARNPRLSMLVLPFDNLRDDGEVAWLRDGSVSMLALALSQWRDLTVVDQARVHDLLSQARVPSDEPIGLALARKLAREAMKLENEISDLVNKAYGLTPEEVALLWRTAPPRMPIAPSLNECRQ